MTDASLLDLNAVRERWLDKDWQLKQALLQRNIDEMWLARDIYDLITECEQNRKALKEAAIATRSLKKQTEGWDLLYKDVLKATAEQWQAIQDYQKQRDEARAALRLLWKEATEVASCYIIASASYQHYISDPCRAAVMAILGGKP